ncbi:Similar to BAIAP2: Brain-specific angiogenesis inhibitor 1-associated protein 2 (Cricetulus griseus) [Cotesia congregata]|uniref:Similar to BAIAP2: Brain-specific angiogenesis inhibitor 1-associated protein 2 (Cricetulus griseus) n=1 Tax=Cotesia congregata TaxID=51543 RepID=A0A8J2HC49_COTCN|nr:Similar to BAIAP2: Brain-specific angiogenesis inhibitor 1-associated protein 2 (Cricetulus griseus) [Cotesia congregata]
MREYKNLKAFYVDLLVPLETNLEKDTKVVQSEQKKFLQQHKTRSETYSKAAATMKKQRKKSRGASKSGLAMDKELKNMQILEEEKSKLDAFCEQSLKNAMTQERRRYGFVLERQCSLAKHYASFHEVALAALHPSVDEWREVANTREYLPQSVEDMFASRLRQVSFWPEDEENGGSELTMSSQLRKTRSMDSSCLELRLGPPPSHPPSSLHAGAPSHLSSALSRARSEANLHASSLSLEPDIPETPPRPRSMAPTSRNSVVGSTSGGGGSGTGVNSGVWGESSLARALFAYLSSGENQLSFLEGDLIALMGDRQKGWQFGENLRTQSSGWFPLAYTEIIIDDSLGSPSHAANNGRSPEPRAMPPCKPPPSRPPPTIDDLSNGGIGIGSGNPSSNSNSSNNNNIGNSNTNTSTPTNVPKSHSSHSVATPTGRQPKSIRPSGTLPSLLAAGRRVQPPMPPVPPPQVVTSLHSSNDSGFSNEPPVQPDIDYSDDEAMRQRRRKTRGERLEAAERAMQMMDKQEKLHKHQGHREENEPDDKGKDWLNDSWKTIPRDEKSWQMYRTAMDLWSESKELDKRDLEGPSGRYGPASRRTSDNYEPHHSKEYNSEYEAKDKRDKVSNDPRKSKYAQSRGSIERPSVGNSNNRYMNGNDHRLRDQSNRRSAEGRRSSSREDLSREIEIDESDEENNQEMNQDEAYNEDYEDKNKVEHIAQKLEQTAQKYAREHSPSKFTERRREDYRKSLERDEKLVSSGTNYDKYERDTRVQRFDRERERERERDRERERERYVDNNNKNNQMNYERERTFEKNPDRNKNIERHSNRRFERPKPPFEDAPERPRELPLPRRERRHSDKEEIYGTTGYGVDKFTGSSEVLVEKDRGYESNFETKLERNKVLEKIVYARSDVDNVSRKMIGYSPERNDNNNNTLKSDKKISQRPHTTLGHIVGQSRSFDKEIMSNSPKLIKRTKSFWRFRRDSEVLEGMALWQHRSLVDIPKTLKREQSKTENINNGSSNNEEEINLSRKSSPNSGSRRSPSKESRSSDNTITNEHSNEVREDPKPAERNIVPEKADYYNDFPTPAERPKAVERSEYRISGREERTYFRGISRKAILENERKRSMEAKRNRVVAELKENNDQGMKKSDCNHKGSLYGEDDDGLIQNFTETEASDEESTYSSIILVMNHVIDALTCIAFIVAFTFKGLAPEINFKSFQKHQCLCDGETPENKDQ